MAVDRPSWVEDVFRPLAVAGMMGCIAASFVRLARLFLPEWSGAFVVGGCVIAALEAHVSNGVVESNRLRGYEALRFRTVELALLLLMVRLGAYLGEPWHSVVQDVRSWPAHPGRILDLEMIYAFLLVLLAWAMSTRTAQDLSRVGEPPGEDRQYVPARASLVDRFFWGGFVLLWTTGLTRIGIASLLDQSRPPVGGLVITVLIYFVLGLALLGQIHFARLSRRWRQEGLETPSGLARHWIGYALLLLGLAALVAFLLPTAYTVPLLDVAAVAVGAVLYVSSVIFQLVILLILLLLAPLARLFGGEVPTGPRKRVLPPESILPPGTQGPPWLEVVKSAAFWAIAVGVVVYLVRSYIRDRPELARLVGRWRPLRAAGRILAALRDWLTTLVKAVHERLPDRLLLRGGPRKGGRPIERQPSLFFPSYVHTRGQRIIQYYLGILRRAAQQGFPRDRSQTPYEYEDRLRPHILEVGPELERLTHVFVETWYGGHDVDSEAQTGIRADWRKVRAALRSLRESRRTGAEAADGRSGGQER